MTDDGERPAGAMPRRGLRVAGSFSDGRPRRRNSDADASLRHRRQWRLADRDSSVLRLVAHDVPDPEAARVGVEVGDLGVNPTNWKSRADHGCAGRRRPRHHEGPEQRGHHRCGRNRHRPATSPATGCASPRGPRADDGRHTGGHACLRRNSRQDYRCRGRRDVASLGVPAHDRASHPHRRPEEQVPAQLGPGTLDTRAVSTQAEPRPFSAPAVQLARGSGARGSVTTVELPQKAALHNRGHTTTSSTTTANTARATPRPSHRHVDQVVEKSLAPNAAAQRERHHQPLHRRGGRDGRRRPG